MIRFYYLLIILLIRCTLIHAQFNLHPTTPKEKRQLRTRVLNNTDHGYWGIDAGLALDFSTLTAVDPQDESMVDNSFKGRFNEEFILFQNFRVFGGYKFKSHYFELAYASYHTNGRLMNSGNLERIQNYYVGSIQFCYYYQLPVKSDFINLLMGPEVGWAFRVKGYGESGYGYYYAGTYFESPSFRASSTNLNDHIKNMIIGFSFRSDFKMKRNLTLFVKANASYVYISKDRYIYDVVSAPPEYLPNYFNPSTAWNLNLSFGLKFDFYSKKKKQQTFEKLGIEDPYKK